MKAKESKTLKGIPNEMETAVILNNIERVTYTDVAALKTITQFSDETISDMYGVNVKTFRSYKNSHTDLTAVVKERTIMLLALMKHGSKVFGSPEKFKAWLDTENFYFGKKAPQRYLTTINGIQFIDDRLTAMQYGDNV